MNYTAKNNHKTGYNDMSAAMLTARGSAFHPSGKNTSFRFIIRRLATILITKMKLVFSRRPQNPQDVLDAQTRRETARRVVDNLLR